MSKADEAVAQQRAINDRLNAIASQIAALPHCLKVRNVGQLGLPDQDVAGAVLNLHTGHVLVLRRKTELASIFRTTGHDVLSLGLVTAPVRELGDSGQSRMTPLSEEDAGKLASTWRAQARLLFPA